MTSGFEKRGFVTEFSFESFLRRVERGKNIPVGVKWIQFVWYKCFSVLFRVHEMLGRWLNRSRHVGFSMCYECGGRPELNEFEQKTKWVSG